MRVRLLFGVVLCAVMLAIAGSAHADERFNNTCGGNGNALGPSWPYGSFNGNITPQLNWQQNCGDGKTIEVELQHNTPGAPNTWVDVDKQPGPGVHDYQFSTPTDMANHLVTRHSILGNPMDCTTPTHGWQYRIHVWWSGGDDKSAALDGPNC